MTDARLVLGLVACVACGDTSAAPSDASADGTEPDVTPPDGPPPPRYVVLGTQGGTSPILVYDITSDGDLDPLREFRSFRAGGTTIAVQIAGNEIFVNTQSEIQVFELDTDGASGAVMPKRFILGHLSGITNSLDMYVFGAEIFTTTTPGEIVVHPIEAHGQVPPLRIIRGPRSYRNVVVVGDEIFASAEAAIDVFPITAAGTSTPIRTLVASELESISGFHATATELFIVDRTDNRVHVFPATASGSVAPLRTIKGLDPNSFSATVVGNELFVPHRGPQTDGSFTDGTYSVFATSADDFATPLRHVVVGGSSLFTLTALDAN